MVKRLDEAERAYSERPGEFVCRFLGGWRVNPVLGVLIRDPRIMTPCAEALEVDRPRFWRHQVFARPQRHPGVVP